MKNPLKRVRLAVPLASALIVGLLAACGGEDPGPGGDGSGFQEIEADYVLYLMEQYLTREGVRSGIVVSDSAYVFDDSTTVHLFGVNMTLFNDDGSERAFVTSQRGWLNQRTEEMLARGNAVLRVPDQGIEVKSAELNYDPRRDQVFSDSISEMTVDGRTSRGTCFRSDLEFRNFSVCDPVGSIPNRPGGGLP